VLELKRKDDYAYSIFVVQSHSVIKAKPKLESMTLLERGRVRLLSIIIDEL